MNLVLLAGALLASPAAGNGLDPLANFCRQVCSLLNLFSINFLAVIHLIRYLGKVRWYHQSQVKNGMLFIDGGLLTFSDRSSIQHVSDLLIKLVLLPGF